MPGCYRSLTESPQRLLFPATRGAVVTFRGCVQLSIRKLTSGRQELTGEAQRIPMNTGSTPSRLAIYAWLLVSIGLGWARGQQSPTSANPSSFPLLTRISDIHALPTRVADRGYPVRIQGVVTFRGEPPFLYVQDSTAGIFVEAPAADPVLTLGDLIEIKGVTGHGWFANQIEKPQIHILGRAPLPAPRHPRFGELALGREAWQVG